MNYDRKVKFYERSHQNMANRINVKLILELKSGGIEYSAGSEPLYPLERATLSAW